MNIESTVALVTGAASGLGLATAQMLHRRRATVVLVDLESSNGPQLAAQLGERAEFIRADVTDEESVRAAVQHAAALGPLRVVVNCAGVVVGRKLVGRSGIFPLDEFRRVIDINLIGTVNVMRHAAEAMMRTNPVGEERGVIINTSSVAAFDGQIGQTAYAASKAAIAGLTLPAARELAESLIRVMTIAPGTFETPMMAGMAEELKNSLAHQVPHPRRLGRPEEFAQLVESIVGNPMLNGEVIRLDGAIRMAPR